MNADLKEVLGNTTAIGDDKWLVRELLIGLQHDYFRCHAAFYQEKLADARTIASSHAAHPVERWRKLFQGVIAQLDEIEGKAAPEGADPQRDAVALAESNGELRFYKDGYTDLRGRFDYASLNSSEGISIQPQPRITGGAPGTGLNTPMLAPDELRLVARLAILVLSETHGALVREANPPSK